jgi:hypothetical protein
MVKTFVKIGVGIEHTTNWRKILQQGGMKKQAVHQRVRYGETEQHGIELD